MTDALYPPQSPTLCVLELFHGPTFAFKDVALQFLGNLFEYFLERRKARGEEVEPITVLGATSGDTGRCAWKQTTSAREFSTQPPDIVRATQRGDLRAAG